MQAGAEALEFVCCAPLLAVVLLAIGQGVTLMRAQAEAEDDARRLVRAHAVCSTHGVPSLIEIDPAATGISDATISGPDSSGVLTESVVLRPRSLIPLAEAWQFSPQASAHMAREPC